MSACIYQSKQTSKQDTHRAKKAVRVIFFVMIITLQAMLQTMLVKYLEVRTLNQTDIHDSASYARKRLGMVQNLDSGLDYGLDYELNYGLHYGLNFGLDWTLATVLALLFKADYEC